MDDVVDFPKPSELREANRLYHEIQDAEEDETERAEAKEMIEIFAESFRNTAAKGDTYIHLDNNYGGENEYFIEHLTSLKYEITVVSKWAKKVSWQ